MLDHGGPDRAPDIVARSTERDRDTPAPLKPMGDVSDQRRERGRRAEADQQAVSDGEFHQGVGLRGQNVAQGKRHRAEDNGLDDADFVRDPAHHGTPDRKTDHRQGEW